jgi:integrase
MSTTPISRNTFRTRIWLPAVRAFGIGWKPRFHDLDRTHASWLLAGGSDLRAVMDQVGHAQLQTTHNTSTPSPTPTNATSTPSTASPADPPSPTQTDEDEVPPASSKRR